MGSILEKQLNILEVSPYQIESVTWSPDGRQLAVTANEGKPGGDGFLILWDVSQLPKPGD